MQVTVDLGAVFVFDDVEDIGTEDGKIIIYPSSPDVIREMDSYGYPIEHIKRYDRYFDFIFNHPKFGIFLRKHGFTRKDISELHDVMVHHTMGNNHVMKLFDEMFSYQTWFEAKALGIPFSPENIVSIS